jgi:hypothetical protein
MQDRAIAKIGSIRNGKPLRFVFLGILRPSAYALGLGLGVALGRPKRRPREAQASSGGNVFVYNENKKMAGGGGAQSAPIAGIARDRKTV